MISTVVCLICTDTHNVLTNCLTQLTMQFGMTPGIHESENTYLLSFNQYYRSENNNESATVMEYKVKV